MNTRLNAVTILAGMLAAGSALADGIKSRSTEDAYNDMMRNWGAPRSTEPAKDVMTRSVEAAYADMMRNWNAQLSGEPQKLAGTQSDRDRYVELMRGTFPLAHLDE